MNAPLSILHLEDSSSDAELISHYVKRQWPTCTITHVQDGDEFQSALGKGGYDIILSDYRLPLYSGDQALKLARTVAPYTPFIMVTGELGEDRAIETLKLGATDYVLKDRLTRLIPAITRALDEATNSAKRRQAEIELRRAHLKTKAMLESITDGYILYNAELRVIDMNHSAEQMIELTREDVIGTELWISGNEQSPEFRTQFMRAVEQRRPMHFEAAGPGLQKWFETHVYPSDDGISVYLRDITARKESEQEIQRKLRQMQVIHQLAEAMGSARQLEEIYEEALTGLCNAVEADRSSILVFDEQGVMRFKAWRGLSEEYRKAVDGHSPWTPDNTHPTPILITDIKEDSSTPAHLLEVILKEGIRGIGFIPLLSNKVLLGKFMVYYDSPHDFTTEEVEISQTIARHVSLAIERKRVEQRLADEARLIQLSLEASEQRAFQHDLAANKLRWSPLSKPMKLFHSPCQDPTSEEWMSMVHVDDREVLENSIRTMLSSGKECSVTYRVITQAGETRWVTGRGRPVINEDGQASSIYGIVTDITDHKVADEALAVAQNELPLITDVMAAAVTRCSKDLRYLWVSKGYAQWLNRTQEEIIGKPISEIVGANAFNALSPHIRRVLSGDRVEYEELIEFSGIGPRWINSVYVPTRDPDGTIDGWVAVVKDITEKKQAEESMQKSRQQYLTLLNSIDGIVWEADPSTLRFTFISSQAERLLGYSIEEWRNDPLFWISHVHPEDRDWVSAYCLDSATTGKRHEFEYRMLARDGSVVWLRDSIEVVTEHGKPLLLRGIMVDITERKNAENELRLFAQELERRVERRTQQLTDANKELEAFSFSVSHDLRAPLRAMSGYARMLMEDAGAKLDPQELHQLENIFHSAQQMGQLVDHLLEFSRLNRKEISRQVISMRSLVELVCRELQQSHERPVDLLIEHDLPAAQGDYTLIRQVLVNLLSNAFKFTRYRENPRIQVGSFRNNGEIVFYVKDNGAGFDMQYYDKLFNVFQRLHSSDDFEGSGVGLAFSQRIIQRHGGRIWAESEAGQGATFYFSLPTHGLETDFLPPTETLHTLQIPSQTS